MAARSLTRQDSPLGEINTTPLIDVMLVLLIMFVITIPAATHTTDFDLPGGPTAGVPNPVVNKVVVTGNDAVLWNGTPISEPEVGVLVQQTLRYPVEPELQFQPQADASYELSSRVLHRIKTAGATKFGFVGNESYREFGKPSLMTR